MARLQTAITSLFGIEHPVILAGMGVVAGPELAAAVTNAGGLGVIGGGLYSPEKLRKELDELKSLLKDPSAAFGVDLLLPQVGGGARKTNYDMTGGKLPELLDIIVESGCKLFVSAVGVPPKWAVDRLHADGVVVMNMIGSPKHVGKALDVGVDLLCAQGGEAGGHTGEIATSLLVPAAVDLCRGKVGPLGHPVHVVAAGGIYDGRGLAMALSLGAEAVWVGTRFVASEEATVPPVHRRQLLSAGYHDTVRTIIYSGRPLRVGKTPYVMDWEENRQAEIRQLTSQGLTPVKVEREKMDPKQFMASQAWLMGQAAGAISDVRPAADILHGMVAEAVQVLRDNHDRVVTGVARL